MTAPRLRVGEVDVEGLSDGILKTSIDLVIGMERALADQWSAARKTDRSSFR